MKTILTVAMVLSLVMTSAYAHTPAEHSSGNVPVGPDEKNIEMCTQNLIAIGEAIQAYQKEHDDLPEWLSDLYPKYLADANILICPEDKAGGKAIASTNVDPKMPVSYGYQFHPEYRKGKSQQRLVYGDAMPLVRCRHHGEDSNCLNLSFSYKIYRSPKVWEHAPEAIYGSHEAAIHAFEEKLEQHPTDMRFFELYSLLITLYLKVGNEQSADELVASFKSTMKPDLWNYFVLGDMLEAMGRYEEMLETFKEAEQQHPDNRFILDRLAYIHRNLGNLGLAEAYGRKADPTYELIGKPVPDFSAADLDGDPISLQDYRGKVVLLDFWAVWCGPCIAEMPNLKKVYDTYKDDGFDIIGISLDNDETKLRDYLKENDILWRQVFSGEGWMNPVAQQYGIRAIPAPWLIDREGNLITHKARGHDLERLVVEALKVKSADQ